MPIYGKFVKEKGFKETIDRLVSSSTITSTKITGDEGPYKLGNLLLGPTDASILLQDGLTPTMKELIVVQLN